MTIRPEPKQVILPRVVVKLFLGNDGKALAVIAEHISTGALSLLLIVNLWIREMIQIK